MKTEKIGIPYSGNYKLALLLCDRIIWHRVLDERYEVRIPSKYVSQPKENRIGGAIHDWQFYFGGDEEAFYDDHFLYQLSGFDNTYVHFPPQNYTSPNNLLSNEGKITYLIENIPAIDIQQIDIQQILQIKEDTSSIKKLRNLNLWLKNIDWSTPNETKEIVEAHMDAYKHALDKHGFKYKVGLLKTLIDPKTIISSSTTAAISSFLLNDFLAALSAAGIVISSSSLQILEGKKWIADEWKEKGGESAFLVELADIPK